MKHFHLAQVSKKQQGFTLTEIMVAITIALILLAGVSQIFASIRRGNNVTNIQGRVQEGLRFATDMIAREIRMAGYTGCKGTSVTNTLNDQSNALYGGKAIIGYEGGVSTFPAVLSDAVAGTDAFKTSRGGDDRGLKFDQKVNAAQFKVNQVNHGLQDGDIIMLTDCKHTSIVQVTNAQPGTNATIVHQTGTSGPGNCTKGMGSTDCSTVNGVSYNWGKAAHVMKYYSFYFYIAPSVSGNTNSLYRVYPDGAGGTIKEELIEGVENMQVLYGEDTDNDGYANRYVKASDVTGGNFDNVVSARVGLLLTTDGELKQTSTSKTYTIAGTSVTTNDKQLRYAINTNIKIRNVGVK